MVQITGDAGMHISSKNCSSTLQRWLAKIFSIFILLFSIFLNFYFLDMYLYIGAGHDLTCPIN